MIVRWIGLVVVGLVLAGCGAGGGHSADWNYGYKFARPLYNSGLYSSLSASEIDLRCTNMINRGAGTYFHGDVNQAISGCKAAMNVGG